MAINISRDPENKTQINKRGEELDRFMKSVVRGEMPKDSSLTAEDGAVVSRGIDEVVAIANGKAHEKDVKALIGAAAAAEVAGKLKLPNEALVEVLKELVKEGHHQEAQDFKEEWCEVEKRSVVTPQNAKQKRLASQKMRELRNMLNEAIDDAFSRRIMRHGI
jgi:polyhydroxyalkanoate synthesis regulator phasin